MSETQSQATATGCAHHVGNHLCKVPPSPELREKLNKQFERLRGEAPKGIAARLRVGSQRHVGFNDGLIYPGTYFPVGTTAAVAQRAALDRAPLRGTVRVIVVLVDFSDKQMAAGAAKRFKDLFFSAGVLPHGSVSEYFSDVSGGAISLAGEVVGPFRMPRTIAAYAGADNGTQRDFPNARTMADDALAAANPTVAFAQYDNDGNGFVDAFVVVHAGRGAEETGAVADIWSHKWVLPAERSVDGTKVFAYLTIPEDAKIGVCAHELGHLVFGWPDLYDTDNSSEGIGNWCLMAGGSWGGGGDRPTHPSAWCKANQGWVSVTTQTANAQITIHDVKSHRAVHRLWKNGAGGTEYFLVENRQQTGYDASLPGQGLLVWHIDEAVETNSNEAHPKVALVQADGKRDLEGNVNRGDDGDPYPGSSGNLSLTGSTTPNSRSYAGLDTCVSVTSISAPGPAMTARVGVSCGVVKPVKEIVKERPKEVVKEFKEHLKEIKDRAKDGKEFAKEVKDHKDLAEHKQFDLPFGALPQPGLVADPVGGLAERLAAVEDALQALAQMVSAAPQAPAGEPFIGRAERPRLGHTVGGADVAELRAAMEAGSGQAKHAFDTLPPT